jgi:hypothetical protein
LDCPPSVTILHRLQGKGWMLGVLDGYGIFSVVGVSLGSVVGSVQDP